MNPEANSFIKVWEFAMKIYYLEQRFSKAKTPSCETLSVRKFPTSNEPQIKP